MPLAALGALAATHVALNVRGGWNTVRQNLVGDAGGRTLTVGFLPVT
jgi:hypothetical protein